MDKVTIVFWSQSGNTESMANAVAEGVTAAGKEAMWKDLQQVRQSLCLALMDGAMDSGCVTG